MRSGPKTPNPRVTPTRTARLAPFALMAVLFLGPASMHSEPGGQGGAITKRLVSRTGLWGIDTGERAQDPPEEPGGRDDVVNERSRSNPKYEPGRVILRLSPGASTSLADLAEEFAATPEPRGSYANFDVLTIDERRKPEEVAERLRAHPDVEYAHAAYRLQADFRPNDPLYDQQWGLTLLDMERAWDINPGASNRVVVAVIDSGLAFLTGTITYTAHRFIDRRGREYPALGTIDVPFSAAPDLDEPSRFVAPYDFIWDDDVPVDLNGHGTHVAGTIGQLTNNGAGAAGMAFNVRLMPLKVLDDDWDRILGAPRAGTADVLARAIRYATEHGTHLINMSLGFRGPLEPEEVRVVEDAMRYAVARGVFIAVSAGNQFEGGNRVQQPAEICSRLDGAMSVAAVAQDRSRAYYSAVGAHVEISAPGGDQRRFGARGGVVQQTLDPLSSATYALPPTLYRAPRFDAFSYRYFQGTSMAAPHVIGLAALLVQQGIRSPAAIETAIRRYAEDLGTPGRDEEFGFGLIRPRHTLRGLGLAR